MRPHLRLRHDLCGTHCVTMCQQTTPTHDTHKGRSINQEKERAGRRRRRPPDRRHVSLEGCAARSPQAHALHALAASPERAPPAERGDNRRFCRVGLLPELSPLVGAADPEETAWGADIRQVHRMRACAVGGNTHLGGSVGAGGRTLSPRRPLSRPPPKEKGHTAATQPPTWGVTAAIPPRYRQTGSHDADGAMGSSTFKGSLHGP
jgi:hypothetical protein